MISRAWNKSESLSKSKLSYSWHLFVPPIGASFTLDCHKGGSKYSLLLLAALRVDLVNQYGLLVQHWYPSLNYLRVNHLHYDYLHCPWLGSHTAANFLIWKGNLFSSLDELAHEGKIHTDDIISYSTLKICVLIIQNLIPLKLILFIIIFSGSPLLRSISI